MPALVPRSAVAADRGDIEPMELVEALRKARF